MVNATLTLTEFLLARIAEDESGYRDWARLMRENVREEGDCQYTRIAALIYSSHPDYRSEWRP